MASTWTEYLRLDKNEDASAVIVICQYEVLGEADCDDDGKEVLPPEIDPQDVVRIEDGLVTGGVLGCLDDQSFEFTAATTVKLSRGWKVFDGSATLDFEPSWPEQSRTNSRRAHHRRMIDDNRRRFFFGRPTDTGPAR